jgi:hypothetical protein
MKFNQIINYLIEGKKVCRTSWKDEHYWYIDAGERLVDSADNIPTINKGQLKADDWIVYKELNKQLKLVLDTLTKEEIEDSIKYLMDEICNNKLFNQMLEQKKLEQEIKEKQKEKK